MRFDYGQRHLVTTYRSILVFRLALSIINLEHLHLAADRIDTGFVVTVHVEIAIENGIFGVADIVNDGANL